MGVAPSKSGARQGRAPGPAAGHSGPGSSTPDTGTSAGGAQSSDPERAAASAAAGGAPAPAAGGGRRGGRGGRKGRAAAPPRKPKKRLRHTILELQSELERCQAQLQEESAKHERSVAHLAILKAVYGIVVALESLSAPDHTPSSDAAALAAISDHLRALQAQVAAAGPATSLGAEPGRSEVWSGIDPPFLPIEPFMERFLAARDVPQPPDIGAFRDRFRGLLLTARAALARYMVRFHAPLGGGPRDDDELDQQLVQLGLEMEGPLMGMVYFQTGHMMDLFTTRMDTGEEAICPQELWDEYANKLLPLTDGQDLYFEALHAWWSRETARLVARRAELAAAALVSPEDAGLQADAVEGLDVATAAWKTYKVAGALIAHMSICSTVHVVATAVGPYPHWTTLTGVLEAISRRRARLRAAAGGAGSQAGAAAH